MIKKIINNLINPILFYADKSGNAVFRNFCCFKNTGNLYKLDLTKPEVGKILEYRFDLNKYLRRASVLITIFVYLIFIHMKLSLWSFIFCETLWIILVATCRAICSYLYSKYLVANFGPYELTEFQPHISNAKWKEYSVNYYSKVLAIGLLLILFIAPAFILEYSMKINLAAKNKNYKTAITISKVYLALYPKIESIYDMRAYAKYVIRDYEGALQDYKTVLELSGKKFKQIDYVRLANLLLLEKKLNNAEIAVDTFNDYATRKKMSILDESQILWIKSIFRVENNIPETILQDYDDLLASLDSKDTRNYFYIMCDKAYILYLIGEYDSAIEIYNIIIPYAEQNRKELEKELKSLYAERAYSKEKIGDVLGADADFMKSEINTLELDKYQPSYNPQEFLKGY